MSDLENVIRQAAYRLWEHAGRPFGQSEAFWHAARQEMEGEAAVDGAGGPPEPTAEEPPEVRAQHGVATGMPGERIAEQGVLDDRLEELALPSLGSFNDD
jgi:hypothetical protein